MQYQKHAVHGGYILKNPTDGEVMFLEMSQEKWSL